jgi:hypothetical protein
MYWWDGIVDTFPENLFTEQREDYMSDNLAIDTTADVPSFTVPELELMPYNDKRWNLILDAYRISIQNELDNMPDENYTLPDKDVISHLIEGMFLDRQKFKIAEILSDRQIL